VKPPADRNVERAAMAGVLLARTMPEAAEAIGQLTPACFTDETCLAAFNAAAAVFRDGGLPDLVSVTLRVAEEHKTKVASILDYVHPAGVYQAHIEELRALAGARRVVRSAALALDVLSESPTDVSAVARLRDDCDAVLAGATSEVRGDALAEAWIAEQREKVERVRQGGLAGVTTGFRGLDRCIGGFQPGLHVILGARSMGKSALLSSILCAVADSGARARLVSLDMPGSSYVARAAAVWYGVPVSRSANGNMGEAEMDHWSSAAVRLSASVQVDEKSRTAKEIVRTARATAGAWDLLAVDFLQAIQGPGKIFDLVREAIYALKGLALEVKKPVVVLSQVPKDMSQNRDDAIPRPTLADAKGAGDIPDASLTVIAPWRPGVTAHGGGPDCDDAEILVLKYQNGPTGRIPVEWTATLAKYEEPAVQSRFDYGCA
jgi:replicative DNA helicase